ncbi:hypothetical protein MN608_00639 [Microdochium nivale]|nr:hypothetical protein MN608_00639 [Microdochium nivale]
MYHGPRGAAELDDRSSRSATSRDEATATRRKKMMNIMFFCFCYFFSDSVFLFLFCCCPSFVSTNAGGFLCFVLPTTEVDQCDFLLDFKEDGRWQISCLPADTLCARLLGQMSQTTQDCSAVIVQPGFQRGKKAKQ